MKTSIRTFTVIIVITLTLSGLSFSRDFPATTTTTPSGRTATTSIVDSPVRGSTTTGRRVVSAIPDQPVRRRGESEDAYQARLQEWLSEIQRMAATASLPVTIPSLPERPVQRRGESPEAYQARVRAWEAQVQQTIDFAKQTQDLQRLMRTPRSTGTINTFGSNPDNILIIPKEEIKLEDFKTIDEDINVMSRIFNNELSKNGIITSNYDLMPWNNPYGILTSTGLSTRRDDNLFNNMYLQGYGALFMIRVNFPLSAPPEAQEQPEEPNIGEVDQVWQQTKEQIYEPQVASAYSYIGAAENLDVKYDAQKVENLKKTLITALKHASNIRALKPDESVIIRITGVGQTINAALPISGGTAIAYSGRTSRSSGIATRTIPQSNANRTQFPESLLIRAKKSDIDAYAEDKLNFDKFREKVQVFSYPILDGNSDN